MDPEEDIHAGLGPSATWVGGTPAFSQGEAAAWRRSYGRLASGEARSGIGESDSTGRSPDSIGGAHAQGLCDGLWQRNAGATDSGDEQAAVGARG